MDQSGSHGSLIIPIGLRNRIIEFFVARGFSKAWLGLVSDGAEYVFSVLPSELTQIDEPAMTMELMMITQRKIWIVGFGDRQPSEVFLDDQSGDQVRVVTRFLRATALTELGMTSAAPVIESAGEALVSGLDTPSLRDLAGRSNTTTLTDIREVLEATYEELGYTYPEPTSPELLLLALEYYALEYLDGRMSARDLVTWAHQNVGHEGPDAAHSLVLLDDELDDGDVDPADLEAEAEVRVRAFLVQRRARGRGFKYP